MKTKKITLSELKKVIKNIIKEYGLSDLNMGSNLRSKKINPEEHVEYNPIINKIVARFKENIRLEMKRIIDNTILDPSNTKDNEIFLEELYSEILSPLLPLVGESQFMQIVDKMVDAKLRKMKITK